MSTAPETSPETGVIGDPLPFEGLEDVEVRHYTGLRDLKRCVKELAEKLVKNYSNQQYLTYDSLKPEDLDEVEKERDKKRFASRMSIAHYEDTDGILLVLKLMPSTSHDLPVVNFAIMLDRRAVLMGADTANELIGMGSSKFEGHSSANEGDSGFKPMTLRNKKDDWPTIVFESGLSESLRRLRVDARWWLQNSVGAVKIVLLISVNPATSTLYIEKWELAPASVAGISTRSGIHNAQLVPTMIQDLLIKPNVPPATSLTLEFENTFLRPAIAPDCDFVFSPQDLAQFADRVWNSLK